MKIEALCVDGGDTQLESGSWEQDHREIAKLQLPLDSAIIKAGLCVRPDSCKFSKKCTGKVVYAEASETGFSKAIITNQSFQKDNNFLI